jgi:mRNA interferase HigB
MHIITRKRILEFAEKHPDCSTAIESWYRIVKRTDFNSLNELRQTFPSADIVGHLTVFNIGGNKVRLIAATEVSRFFRVTRSLRETLYQ